MRFAAAACFAIVCSSPALAQRHDVDVPSGRLGDAAAQLGRQMRVSIGISDPLLAEQRVGSVRGRLTLDDALRRLLRGTDGSFVAIDGRTVRIVRRAPRAPRPALTRAAERPESVRTPLAETAPTDIVVTASRRDVLLRSYPGSVAIVAGDDPALASTGGSQGLVLRLPSVASTHLGPGRNKLFVRGVSDSSFQGPTQATTGQYLGETRVNYNAPDPDLRLFDIDRIEVLVGPQGTNYGAGSMGGIVRLVPTPPSTGTFEAVTTVGASATAHGDPGFDAGAVVNLPLAKDRAGLRFSSYAVREGGYIDDLQRGLSDVNRVDIIGARLALRLQAGEVWTIDIGATGQRIRGDDAQFAEKGLPRLTRRSSLRQNFGNDYLLSSATAVKAWDGYRFVATGGLVHQELRERFDATPLGLARTAYDLATDVSFANAEARLSRRGEGGIDWLIGGSLLSNRSRQRREVELVTFSYLRNAVRNSIVEGALFGEAEMRVLPDIRLTVGGRLSGSRLSGSGFVSVPGDALPSSPTRAVRDAVTFLPSGSVSIQATDTLLVYGRYQQSFRPGGLGFSGSGVSRFRSDKLASAELGLRHGTPGVGPFDASAAIAYTRWSDIQADVLSNTAEPATANIGDGRIYALDLAVGYRPVRSLGLEAAAVLNDGTLTRPAAGIVAGPSSSLPNVARFNGRLAASYDMAASDRALLRFTAAARYTGRSRLGIGQVIEKGQGGWVDVSLGLRAELARHSLSLTVTNLLDSDASRFALGSPFALSFIDHTTPLRPRTVRLGWQARF